MKQRTRLKKRPHARACWGAHPLAMTRMVVQRPKQGIGEEAGESYGKTSFLPVLCRMSKVIHRHIKTCCRVFTQNASILSCTDHDHDHDHDNHTTTRLQPTPNGLALCSHITLDAPPWVPARTPTVHGGPYAGRPCVAGRHTRTTTQHKNDPNFVMHY